MTLGMSFFLLAIAYGVVCGGVYTWISPRRSGSWPRMWRATCLFTLLGLVLALLAYIVLR